MDRENVVRVNRRQVVSSGLQIRLTELEAEWNPCPQYTAFCFSYSNQQINHSHGWIDSNLTFHFYRWPSVINLPKTRNNFLRTDEVSDVPACDGDTKQATERRTSLIGHELGENDVSCPRADIVEALSKILYRRIYSLLVDLPLQIINRLNNKVCNWSLQRSFVEGDSMMNCKLLKCRQQGS